MRRPPLLAALVLVAGAAVAAGVYKWVDEQGRTHYGDAPPQGKPAQPLTLPPQPPKEQLDQARQAFERQQSERARRETAQQVLGTLVLGFSASPGASLPAPPFALTLVAMAEADRSERRFELRDGIPEWTLTGDGRATLRTGFALALRPGDYRVLAVEVSSPSLADKPVTLPVGQPRFGVPEGRCAYIGRIAYLYQRLPVLSLERATATVAAATRESGGSALLVYLTTGSLVLQTTVVDRPDEGRAPSVHDREPLVRARAQDCAADGPRL